jgi:flagellar hook-associated protein FlgK
MCKEKLHDVLGGASGMTKAFKTIETTLTNVKGAAETRINQMVGFERVSRMDKL